jgi:hypothetical protein
MANILKIGGIGDKLATREIRTEIQLSPEQNRAKKRFDGFYTQIQLAERGTAEEIRLLKAELEADERMVQLKKLQRKQKKLRAAAEQTLASIDTIHEIAMAESGVLRGVRKLDVYLQSIGFDGDED